MWGGADEPGTNTTDRLNGNSFNAQKPTDRLTDHKGKAVQIRLKPAGTGNKRNKNRQEQHHNLVSRMKENG